MTITNTETEEKYYCKYCGKSSSSESLLWQCLCQNNPEGKNHVVYEGSKKSKYQCVYCSINSLTKVLCEKNTEGKYHVPYEGDKKEMYSCKYCGSSYYTIKELTSELCLRNPKGKFHVPAK